MDANAANNMDACDAWNIRFQTAVSMPEVTQEERREKYNMLNSVNKDFIAIATVYAKTIISEYFLPDEKKSIKIKEVGGLAGGKKFLWRDILFKLVDSTQGPYERDHEAASKAMGHEMKAVNAYFRCTMADIHVALQALIDYKGFRMLAQAYLPIDGKNSLIVGSADGMVSVHNSLGALSSAQGELVRNSEDSLKYAAIELNISPHKVGKVTMYSACDVEGHIGADGRFYIIDLARTFPPESPCKAPHLIQRSGFHLGQVVVVAIPVEESAPDVEAEFAGSGTAGGVASGRVSPPPASGPLQARSSSADSLALSVNSSNSGGGGRKKDRLPKAPSSPSFVPSSSSGAGRRRPPRFRKYRGFVCRVWPNGLYDVFCPPAPSSPAASSPAHVNVNPGSYASAGRTKTPPPPPQADGSAQSQATLEQQAILERLRRVSEGSERVSQSELAQVLDKFMRSVDEGTGGHKKTRLNSVSSQTALHGVQSGSEPGAGGAAVMPAGGRVLHSVREEWVLPAGQTIFWRLLRPEFVKHRGAGAICAYKKRLEGRERERERRQAGGAAEGLGLDRWAEQRDDCYEQYYLSHQLLLASGSDCLLYGDQEEEEADDLASGGLGAAARDDSLAGLRLGQGRLSRRGQSANLFDVFDDEAEGAVVHAYDPDAAPQTGYTSGQAVGFAGGWQGETGADGDGGDVDGDGDDDGGTGWAFSCDADSGSEEEQSRVTVVAAAPALPSADTVVVQTPAATAGWAPAARARPPRLSMNTYASAAALDFSNICSDAMNVYQYANAELLAEDMFDELQAMRELRGRRSDVQLMRDRLRRKKLKERAELQAKMRRDQEENAQERAQLFPSGGRQPSPVASRGTSGSLAGIEIDVGGDLLSSEVAGQGLTRRQSSVLSLNLAEEGEGAALDLLNSPSPDLQQLLKRDSSAASGVSLAAASVGSGGALYRHKKAALRDSKLRDQAAASADALAAGDEEAEVIQTVDLYGMETADGSVLRSAPTPLSSDALSGFSREKAKDNEIHEATRTLVNELVPAVADDLMCNGHPLGREGLGLSLVEYVHQNGINMRHVGLLRSHIDPWSSVVTEKAETAEAARDCINAQLKIRQELLHQCVVRTLKHILQDLQRRYMRRKQNSSSELFMHVLVTQFLNLVTGAHSYSIFFWRMIVTPGLYRRFGEITLGADEKDDDGCADLFDLGLEQTDAGLQLDEELRSSEAGAGACGSGAGPESDDLDFILNCFLGDMNSTSGGGGGGDTSCSGAGGGHGGCFPVHNVHKMKTRSRLMELCCIVDPETLRALIKGLCKCTGIQVSQECKNNFSKAQLIFGFEFAISDIRDLCPVVKHMHQVDLARGIGLSLEAERHSMLSAEELASSGGGRSGDGAAGAVYEKFKLVKNCYSEYVNIVHSLSQEEAGDFVHRRKSNSLAISIRLGNLAAKVLRSALKAIPDDLKTKMALADTYQTIAHAIANHYSLENGGGAGGNASILLSMTSTGASLGGGGPSSPLPADAAALLNDPMYRRMQECFSLFRNLCEHTRCCELGLSYKQDILGFVVIVQHHHEDRATEQRKSDALAKVVKGRAGGKAGLPPAASPPSVGAGKHAAAAATTTGINDGAAAAAKAPVENYFYRDTKSIKDVFIHRMGVSLHAFLREVRENYTDKGLRCNLRFLPLIIDQEHASRGRRLLCEEMVRMDCLSDNIYESPVRADQKLVRRPGDLVLKDYGACAPTPGPGAPAAIIQRLNRTRVVLPEFSALVGFRVMAALMNRVVMNYCLDQQFSIDGVKRHEGPPVAVGGGKGGKGGAAGKSFNPEEYFTSYARLHHMLLYMSTLDEDWKKIANRVVETFLNDKASRLKRHTPDLGRLLIYLLLSKHEWDETFAEAYLEEALSRQVSWFLADSSYKKGSKKKVQLQAAETIVAEEPSPGRKGAGRGRKVGRDDVGGGLVLPGGATSASGAGAPEGLQRQGSDCSTASSSEQAGRQDEKICPELGILEGDEYVSPYRLVTTFNSTKLISLRSLMFQVYFMHSIARKNIAGEQRGVVQASSSGNLSTLNRSGSLSGTSTPSLMRNISFGTRAGGVNVSPAHAAGKGGLRHGFGSLDRLAAAGLGPVFGGDRTDSEAGRSSSPLMSATPDIVDLEDGCSTTASVLSTQLGEGVAGSVTAGMGTLGVGLPPNRFPSSASTLASYSAATSGGATYSAEQAEQVAESREMVLLQLYNSSFGKPTAGMRANLREEFDSIMAVANYEQFLEKIKLKKSPYQLSCMLREAVVNSVQKRYIQHISLNVADLRDWDAVISNNHNNKSKSANKPRLSAANARIVAESIEQCFLPAQATWAEVFASYERCATNKIYDVTLTPLLADRMRQLVQSGTAATASGGGGGRQDKGGSVGGHGRSQSYPLGGGGGSHAGRGSAGPRGSRAQPAPGPVAGPAGPVPAAPVHIPVAQTKRVSGDMEWSFVVKAHAQTGAGTDRETAPAPAPAAAPLELKLSASPLGNIDRPLHPPLFAGPVSAQHGAHKPAGAPSSHLAVEGSRHPLPAGPAGRGRGHFRDRSGSESSGGGGDRSRRGQGGARASNSGSGSGSTPSSPVRRPGGANSAQLLTASAATFLPASVVVSAASSTSSSEGVALSRPKQSQEPVADVLLSAALGLSVPPLMIPPAGVAGQAQAQGSVGTLGASAERLFSYSAVLSRAPSGDGGGIGAGSASASQSFSDSESQSSAPPSPAFARGGRARSNNNNNNNNNSNGSAAPGGGGGGGSHRRMGSRGLREGK